MKYTHFGAELPFDCLGISRDRYIFTPVRGIYLTKGLPKAGRRNDA